MNIETEDGVPAFSGSGMELLALAPTESRAWLMYDRLCTELEASAGTRRKWAKLIEASWGPREC